MKKLLMGALVLTLLLTGCSSTGSESGDTAKKSDTVFVDTDGISVELTSLEYSEEDEALYFGINFINESKEDYYFSASYIAVNGVEYYDTMDDTVLAGSTSSQEGTFYDDTGIFTGTDDVSQIDIALTVCAQDDGDDIIYEGIVSVYPNDEEITYSPQGTLLYEDDYMAVYLEEVEFEEYWGYTAYVYAENKTDEDLWLYTTGLTIDGEFYDGGANTPLHEGYGTVFGAWGYTEDEDAESMSFDLQVFKRENVRNNLNNSGDPEETVTITVK